MLHKDLRSDGPPVVLLSSTTLLHYSLLEHAVIQSAKWPPTIYPIGTRAKYTSIVPSAYYTRTVSPITECKHTVVSISDVL